MAKPKKVDIDLVAEVITKLVDADTAKRAIVLLSRTAKEEGDEKAKEPKPKKQFGVFILQPAGVTLPEDMTGWVFQVNEETHLPSVLGAVAVAAATYNSTKKGRKNPVKSTGEAFEAIPAKLFKEFGGLSVKTKLPVWILPAPSVLPVSRAGE